MTASLTDYIAIVRRATAGCDMLLRRPDFATATPAMLAGMINDQINATTALAGFLERALQDPDWIAEQRHLAYPPLSPKPALRVVTGNDGPDAA